MSDVRRYYDADPEKEWRRLDRDRLEFALTMRALREYLPPPPARVVDIGGGPGRYAIALTQVGYGVTLADISPAELALAREKAAGCGATLDAIVEADARDLSRFADASFGAAVMMGPLYHLLDTSDRRRAVTEARRVLRPGGVIFAAFLMRYATLRFWAKYDPIRVVNDLARYEQHISTGMAPGAVEFTDIYLAHPTEVRPFMEALDFETLDLVGVEGVVSMIRDRIDQLDGDAWDTWMDINYRLGKDPCTHGTTEHLLYVGRKP